MEREGRAMKRHALIALVLAASLGLAGCASIQAPASFGGQGPTDKSRVAEHGGPPWPFPVDRPFSRFCYWC